MQYISGHNLIKFSSISCMIFSEVLRGVQNGVGVGLDYKAERDGLGANLSRACNTNHKKNAERRGLMKSKLDFK